MNKLFLYMIMLPSALWKSMGADIVQLRAILNVRLILDDRKPASIGRAQSQTKSRKFGTLLNIFLSFVMGCFYMLPLIVIPDRIFSLTLYFSLLLTMITFMLVIDFSSVLFDARDKYILFPRPVGDRTLVLARLLHVFIYIFRIIFPMSLGGWVWLGYHDGWLSAALFPLPVILLVFIALFLVNGIYLLVLRLAKPEKFKDVINYFQVFTSVVIFACVYLLPKAFNGQNPADFNILKFPWIRFVPSYWLAACWAWIGYPVALSGTALFSVLALAFPLFCLYALVTWLAPQFSRRIGGIDVSDSGPAETGVAGKQSAQGKLYKKLAYLLNTSDEARAGFMISWLQTSRSRTFRMKVYPTFAYVPVYFVYMLTSNHATISDAMHHISDKPRYLFLLYMSSFVLISALTYLTISDQYKAAWVYYSTPVGVPGRVMAGALKALWTKYFVPFFLLISIFVVYSWGPATLPDIVLALVNVTLFVACIARVSYRHLPFSVMEQMKQQGGNRMIKSFLVMIIPSSLGLGHFFAIHLLWLKLIFLGLSSILLWLVWDSYANTTWNNVMKTNNE